METMNKKLVAALTSLALGACGTPDTGYQKPATDSAARARVRELRHLLVLPPSFQLIHGNMDGSPPAGCGNTRRISANIEAAVASRLNDWKDYRTVRPAQDDGAARERLARLQAGLSEDAVEHPFPERAPAPLREELGQISRQYGVDAVVVIAAREVGLSAGTFANTLGLSLFTLGIGGMAYVFSVIGTFTDAAIYDSEGQLQWWFRGQIEAGNICGSQVEQVMAPVFDTLPNALPAALTPATDKP